MITIPLEMMLILKPSAPAFSDRIWDLVQLMVVGAILAPGKRTVTAVLRVMGLSEEKQIQNYVVSSDCVYSCFLQQPPVGS